MSYLPNLYSTVGFDSVLKRLEDAANTTLKAVTYPPYNIRKIDDNKYAVELAVAGFGKSNIDITLEDNVLKITGSVDADSNTHYLYKGIAERAFTRSFTLADTIEVKGAELLNGMLKVLLENVVPDNKKPRKIEVIDPVGSKPQTLNG